MAHEHKDGSCSCGADHGKDPELELELALDSGQQALERALRQSFVLLKFVMVLVLGLFIWSGMFEVPTSERAVKLRFGAVVGERSEAILGPGWHWSWPYPIEEIVRFPVAGNKTGIDVDSFWYYESEADKVSKNPRILPELQIVSDGYSLTAAEAIDPDVAELVAQKGNGRDCSLIHTKWTINYEVRESDDRQYENYLNLFEKGWDGTDAGWGNIESLLTRALEDSVINVSAQRDINWMLTKERGQMVLDVAQLFKKRVAEMDMGLEAELVLREKVKPRQVKRAFDEATRAHNEADKLKTQAHTIESKILTGARSQKEIVIAQAQSYKTLVVQSAKSEAQYMERLLEQIEETASKEVDRAKDPEKWRQKYKALLEINLDILYQEMLGEVASKADEVFLNGQSEQIRVQLNRDPNIKRKKK